MIEKNANADEGEPVTKHQTIFVVWTQQLNGELQV